MGKKYPVITGVKCGPDLSKRPFLSLSLNQICLAKVVSYRKELIDRERLLPNHRNLTQVEREGVGENLDTTLIVCIFFLDLDGSSNDLKDFVKMETLEVRGYVVERPFFFNRITVHNLTVDSVPKG